MPNSCWNQYNIVFITGLSPINFNRTWIWLTSYSLSLLYISYSTATKSWYHILHSGQISFLSVLNKCHVCSVERLWQSLSKVTLHWYLVQNFQVDFYMKWKCGKYRLLKRFPNQYCTYPQLWSRYWFMNGNGFPLPINATECCFGHPPPPSNDWGNICRGSTPCSVTNTSSDTLIMCNVDWRESGFLPT